jgi:hypothetical protein
VPNTPLIYQEQLMGSTFGWILSGILVLALGLVITLVVAFPQPSDATSATQQKGFFDKCEPTKPVSDAIGYTPNAPGNAADDYVRAMSVMNQNRRALDMGRQNIGKCVPPSAESLAAYEEVAKLVRPAANKKQMKYTMVYTPKALRVSKMPQGFAALRAVGSCLADLAVAYRDAKQYDKSMEVVKLRFVLGWHMMNERARAMTVTAGMEIQQGAAEEIAELYTLMGKPGKAARPQAYANGISRGVGLYNRKLNTLWVLQTRRSTKSAKATPGDIFRYVEEDEDIVWRIDGTLYLGQIRAQVKHRGDLRVANNLIEESAKSDNEYLRAAAEAARIVTIEDIRRSAAN